MKDKKVLLVEDDRDFINAVKIVLEHFGFDVVTVYDGEMGFSKAREIMPDLVILDVMLPKKDGYAVCYDLKNNEDTSHIPVMILTSLGKQEEGKDGADILTRGHCADAYLEKPIEPNLLAIKAIELVKNSHIVHKKKSRILIIDDDTDFTEAIKTILEHETYDVITACSGKEGLLLASREMPDLILLDVMLPDVDGYAVCKELKEREKTKTIPIAMLTSIGEKLTEPGYAKAIAVTHKADEYIEKPVEAKELVKRVRSLIGPMRRLI